ncbi:polyphosphate kinase 1 [Aridibaculum aurantiacum]|uniref:polyphosphate kinase 1 n=1 Tax=Aridibaculum aurantiacum TaxID=2810307 RepID=UPI001A95E27A|nr:polyphosphate kinase 1 [Aridibaculum aurantiacum]
MHKKKLIPRDISWLGFNARVLQEANDPSVPLKERIRFLGIFSNNLDEFFRVRVATLRRMTVIGKNNMHLEENPQQILQDIQLIVLQQQNEFARIWNEILKELQQQKIHLVTEQQLNKEQQVFVKKFFEEEVRANVIPLLIESIPVFPYLREKSIYLGVVMRKQQTAYDQKYAIIEVPANAVGRFILLPSKPGEHNIILLEDVIRFNLPDVFSYFGYDSFTSHVFNVTKDAEIDIDNDISTSFIQKIEKGLKNRRRGKPVRFVYDKEMDAGLLEFLIRKLNLSSRDNIIPGGRIHNYRHFMDFPDVFEQKSTRRQPFPHPSLKNYNRVTDVILKEDVMLHFPYHSFNAIIDLLREAAIDPQVTNIKITAYRLAKSSKVVNALINAARNGKDVTVMLELRARFDEEANLEWKVKMEDEGVKVLMGLPNMKVHAKLCIIKKRLENRVIQYGFVSTGNLNEQTARVYGDHCLLTSNRHIMADINRIFRVFENPRRGVASLKLCKTLLVCPNLMRKEINALINKEIRNAKANKPAAITLKLNSLSDEPLILKLYEAAHAGVQIKLIIRSIFCIMMHSKKMKQNVVPISIVDEYLEHARVMIFLNDGNEKVYISSADWMVRNLDHRIEAAAPVMDEAIKQEIIDIINIQLQDNVKARLLDDQLSNLYVPTQGKKVRSQIETFNYLNKKSHLQSENSSH